MERVKRKYLELVGLLVTNSTKVDTYHIDYVYKWKVGGNLEGTAVQKGFDFRLHTTFQEIVAALQNAYAPAIQRQWTHQTPRMKRVFMALCVGVGPAIFDDGAPWELDYER